MHDGIGHMVPSGRHPPGQASPGKHSPRPDSERAVRILLECILVHSLSAQLFLVLLQSIILYAQRRWLIIEYLKALSHQILKEFTVESIDFLSDSAASFFKGILSYFGNCISQNYVISHFLLQLSNASVYVDLLMN